MKYDFVVNNSDVFSIKRMCHNLEIKASAYYAYLRRGPSIRSIEDEQIYEEILNIRKERFKSKTGSPILTRELKSRGKHHGQKRIARIMRENGLVGGRKKRHKYLKTPGREIQVAENILNREFSPSNPNEKWCSDITYIRTKAGWAYLCVVLDLFSKMIVGWYLSKNPDTDLVIKAVEDAYCNRKPRYQVLLHSDRGCQYTSEEYLKILDKYNLKKSFSRKGNCWDNACAESFFGHLKLEAIEGKIFENMDDLMAELTEYINIYYNANRLHSSNGFQAPMEIEEKRA